MAPASDSAHQGLFPTREFRLGVVLQTTRHHGGYPQASRETVDQARQLGRVGKRPGSFEQHALPPLQRRMPGNVHADARHRLG